MYPEVGEEFVAAMEEVIEIYTAPHELHHPVICFDESPFQLLRHVRDPLPAPPGVARREDYEYERAGVVDVMMICQPALGLRKRLVTPSRKKVDFAGVCAEIDRMFPQAKSITLVSDNLNTHTKGAFYLAFEPAQARRLARKFNFVHTPKHGSWLNIAEIELAVLGKTVFKKRIGDAQTLQTELDALCASRNQEAIPVRWQFNLGKARKKMSWMYPDLIDANQVD